DVVERLPQPPRDPAHDARLRFGRMVRQQERAGVAQALEPAPVGGLDRNAHDALPPGQERRVEEIHRLGDEPALSRWLETVCHHWDLIEYFILLVCAKGCSP